MSDETCSLCLDNYIIGDLNLVLNCGHQFHYSCGIKIKDKSKCCICNTIVKDTAKIIWTTHVSFFKFIEPDIFFSIAVNTVFFKDRINNLVYNHNLLHSKNLLRSYEKTIFKFVKHHLQSFYINILSSMNKGKCNTVLCSFHYGYTFNNIPLVFLLYGPKNIGLDYFKNNNIICLIDLLQLYFNTGFHIYLHKKNMKNFISIKWNIC